MGCGCLFRKSPNFYRVFQSNRSISIKSIKMSKAHPPELKKYMDKKLSLKLNGNRTVVGILRGFDPFMNLVVEDAIEETGAQVKNNIGMVVIRGNSVVLME